MDFVEGFPCINDKSIILTVVDRFLKYAHFITLGYTIHDDIGGTSFLRRR
jgi:hypothetical protein